MPAVFEFLVCFLYSRQFLVRWYSRFYQQAEVEEFISRAREPDVGGELLLEHKSEFVYTTLWSSNNVEI